VKTFYLFCLFAVSAFAQDWLQMFNGKDLTGWTPKISGYALGDNFANTFRVKDGYLSVGYEGYDSFLDANKAGKFGHIFYQRPFSYYVIATAAS